MAIDTDKITPGQQVRVEIVKRPTNAAALKTIQRLLGKDPQIAKNDEVATNRRRRGFKTKPRGGRPWNLYKSRLPLVHGEVGEAGTLKATVDVIRDLGSVSKFVQITAAQ